MTAPRCLLRCRGGRSLSAAWVAALSLWVSSCAMGQALATRLPSGVQPTHYKLSLIPDAQHLSFRARALATIAVTQPTRQITLNALSLEFATAHLMDPTGEVVLATPTVKLDLLAQTAQFQFDEAIPTGHYVLDMAYSGAISTQAAGLFAVDYDSEQGRKRALYTQFESSDARRLLPCWDEPNFKASFELEVLLPHEQMAISNMPVANRVSAQPGLDRVRFEATPVMSTYLLFLALGEFERTSVLSGSTELGVVTKKGSLSQANFVLESSKAILAEYNDYFDIPYPLPKLDNVAAPGASRMFDAMENWGAILSFEHTLLLDPSNATEADKQNLFVIAAHEMAHQWFGNLVTMRWWDDLWLNEGFASWMESRTTARLHPEWNAPMTAVYSREQAMEVDAFQTTHPVVQRVATVDQASQAFDEITYQKGEAVIRMLEQFVGETVWREGVRSYLKKYALSNAVSDDLWREMDRVSGQDVSAMAHDFTLQPGVPLIRVNAAECVQGQTLVVLEQAEFSQDRPAKQALRWRVPVRVQLLSGAAVRTVVEQGRTQLALAGCGPVIVNAGQSGYYRSLYRPENFRAIAQGFAQLEPIDQLGILSDAWALGLAGQQPFADFLRLANAKTIGTDTQVWGKIVQAYGSLHALYRTEGATVAKRRARFERYATLQLRPVMERMGWEEQEDEAQAVAILRAQMLLQLAALGDPEVVTHARQVFKVLTNAPEKVPTPQKKTVMAIVARHADVTTWNQLHAMARAEKTPLLQDQLYVLLASAEDPALARRALQLSLGAEVAETNSATMIQTVAQLHPDLAFDFALAHRAQVQHKIEASAVAQFFPGLASNSLKPAMPSKLQSFLRRHVDPESRASAETVLANIRYRIQLHKHRLADVDAWIRQP